MLFLCIQLLQVPWTEHVQIFLLLLLRLETSKQLIILQRKWILDQLSSFSFSHASNVMAFERGSVCGFPAVEWSVVLSSSI